MRKEYRIRDSGAAPISDADIRRYRDFGRLVYNYERMTRPLYRRPLYKDPKSFLVILIIVLLTIFIAEVVEKERPHPPAPPVPERSP